MQFVTNPIPELPHEELAARAARIKVVIGRPGGDLWAISTKVMSDSLLNGERAEFTDPVVELSRLTVYFLRTASGTFCPTIGEALAQIPAQHLDEVHACHLTPRFEQAPGGDYHELEAILYKAA